MLAEILTEVMKKATFTFNKVCATIIYTCEIVGNDMSDLKLFVPEKIKTTGRRNDKVAARIKECFSTELTKGHFPILPGHEIESRLPTSITITFVDLSPDLRNAIIYFMPLGGIKKEECSRFFELQTHHFKNIIAKKMRMRSIPNIAFKLDNSFEYSNKIENLINKK